jgi:hypothetical protein
MTQPFVSVPLAEAAQTDPAIRDLLSKVERGEVSVCAPFEGMDRPWSEDDKARFRDALGEVFGWDKLAGRSEPQS